MSTTPIAVSIASCAEDVFIVWANTRGTHTPVASCGSAAHAGVVKAALVRFAEQQPEMLLAALEALPRVAVPTAYGSTL